VSTGTQVEVVMPQMGVSVSEGTITRWLKQAGDSVALDEPLLEISTDKVDTEVPSPASGTVTQIFVQEGETVEVGTKLAQIGGAGVGGAAGRGQQPAGHRQCGGRAGDSLAHRQRRYEFHLAVQHRPYRRQPVALATAGGRAGRLLLPALRPEIAGAKAALG